MPDKTLFFVQPYTIRRGKLMACGALTFRDRGEALHLGARLARKHAGTVVLAQSYDVARKALLRPSVLGIHGQVPAEWVDAKTAA